MNRITLRNLSSVTEISKNEMKATLGGRHGAGEVEKEVELEPNHTAAAPAAGAAKLPGVVELVHRRRRRRRGRLGM